MVAVTVSSDSAIVKFCAKHSGAGPELPSGPPLQAAALDFRGGDLFYDGKGINYKVRFVLIIEGVFCFRMRFCFLVAHREFFFFFSCQFSESHCLVDGTWFERYISLVSDVAYCP